ncbi:MAG TPA: sulfite oxidase [Gemmataceae bacterium]|nr:sulfite oxidase [Gemmataceae bacterium]
MDLLPRRQFLRTAALAPLAIAAWPRVLRADSPQQIMRMNSPQNLEWNFATLNGFLTPTDSFYVRNHFPMPKIDREKWRLKVDGTVERPLELSLDDIVKMQSKTRPLLLECAGNGRVFLTPAPKGVAWQLGAVGNAEWTGAALADILDKAGVKKGAAEVLLEGADSGAVADPPSPGAIPFARSLPLEKAKSPEVILAYQMNGNDLTTAHGAPLRAMVGGWYGMASVKWLTRIVVVEKRHRGFFQAVDYCYFERQHGLASVVPITAMQVKSQIAQPALSETIPAGKPYRVAGAAWTGEGEIAKVEVSADGGKHWHEAKLDAATAPFCWRLWQWEWKEPKAGRATLMSRATDSKGRTQPTERNQDYRNYMIHHVLPVDVEVK